MNLCMNCYSESGQESQSDPTEINLLTLGFFSFLFNLFFINTGGLRRLICLDMTRFPNAAVDSMHCFTCIS